MASNLEDEMRRQGLYLEDQYGPCTIPKYAKNSLVLDISVCPECSLVFSSRTTLDSHMWESHRMHFSDLYDCPCCYVRLQTKEQIDMHLEIAHPRVLTVPDHTSQPSQPTAN